MSDSALYERRQAYSSVCVKRRFDRSPLNVSAALHSIGHRSLVSLPYDILLNIADLLDTEDVVALEGTCRSLRDFTQTRSIWLKLATNMLDMCQPLPVSGFQRIWELRTPELASLIRRGRKLQHSWSKQKPKLMLPYTTITAPKNEDIVWLSPITSKYTLCCTKGGKVMCWDVFRSECVAEWHSGADWEIWKCRVEFEERTVYFAMAKRVQIGVGTDCQLMALTFPPEVNGALLGNPAFSKLSFFYFPGHVISVYLLDPLRRLLSAYIWIEATRTLGLYVLLDWAVPYYVFLDTGISCDPLREWSCIGYDPDNVVIHAEELQEESDWAYQFSYSYSFLRKIATLQPPTGTPRLIPPNQTVQLPFLPNDHPSFHEYGSQSAHFVRQWWPTLQHTDSIRRRSCTIILLAKRVEGPDDDDPTVVNAAPDQPPPGTHLFTIAQHYFSIPLCSKQLRWWYVREPFEIVCFPQAMSIPADHGDGALFGNEGEGGNGDGEIGYHEHHHAHNAAGAAGAAAENAEGHNQNPDPSGLEPEHAPHQAGAEPATPAPVPVPAPIPALIPAPVPAPIPALVPIPVLADAAPPTPHAIDHDLIADDFLDDGEGLHVIPLIAVDFGCAVWLEYVSYGSDEKRLRLVTFPPVDVDRSTPSFSCLSGEGDVRTLDVPSEIDLGKVCHIGIDQAQGTVILGLSTGNVHIMHYR